MWTLLYGSNSLGYECNSLCVKCLSHLHLGHLLTYFPHLLNIPATTFQTLTFFGQLLFHNVCHHVHTLLRSFFVFLYVPPYHHCRLLLSLPSVCILPSCRIFQFKNNITPTCSFSFSILFYLNSFLCHSLQW